MIGSKAMRAGALAAALAITACVDLGSFHLSVSSLDIGPDQAMPGDLVQASFIVRLAPVQRHTIILTIDGTEHIRVTSDEAPPVLNVLNLGDAADLISTYGLGMHSARVEVLAEEKDERARSQSASFELRESTP